MTSKPTCRPLDARRFPDTIADSFPMLLDFLANLSLFDSDEMRRHATIPMGAVRRRAIAYSES